MSWKVCLFILSWWPHHVARLTATRESAGLELSGLELFDRDGSPDGYGGGDAERSRVRIETLFVGPGSPSATRELSAVRRSVVSRLEGERPDLLAVVGYSEPCMRIAAGWARRRNVPCVLCFTSTAWDRRRRAWWEALKGEWIRRRFDACFVPGARSAEYLARLGYPPERIWRGYNVVDNDRLAERAGRARLEGDRQRTELALPERYLLFVGRLAREKNLTTLLEAFSLYRRRTRHDPLGLVLVGAGPLEPALRERAAALGLSDVTWPGFRRHEELSAFYALAEALVLPSLSESWGLVANEAMACGLPVLASTRCGCVPDLVYPGVNGFVFDPKDAEGLSRLIERVGSGELELARMGHASRQVIAPYSLAAWVRAFGDCVRTTLASRS